MKLTGKQLFEWFREEARGPSWERLSLLEQVPWEALAEKLNGMMAGKHSWLGAQAAPMAAGTETPKITEWALKGTRDEEVRRYNADLDRDFGAELRRQLAAAYRESLDRSFHHATCPYRHGRGDCTC